MPIYEFKCKNCDKKFEKLTFKSLSETEIVCPFCQSKDVIKLISAPGAVGGSTKISEKSDNSYPSCSTCCGGTCPTNFD